jgi:hypothetical protein
MIEIYLIYRRCIIVIRLTFWTVHVLSESSDRVAANFFLNLKPSRNDATPFFFARVENPTARENKLWACNNYERSATKFSKIRLMLVYLHRLNLLQTHDRDLQ